MLDFDGCVHIKKIVVYTILNSLGEVLIGFENVSYLNI